MNIFSFTGNLGKDCETRFTPDSKAITSFSVAVKSGYGKNESTTWANCSIWGDRGEKIAQYLKKGQLVGITGELTLREWTDKEGGKRQNLEVRVNDLTLLGGRASDTPRQSNEQAPQAKGGFDDFSSDIPF